MPEDLWLRLPLIKCYNAEEFKVDVHFECTMCGKCCHNLKLPLSIDEAIRWLDQGGDVQILCEAIPWPEEPTSENLQALHKRARSFAACSGDMPTRIVVLVVAAFEGACPHLLPDMRCGNYELRPRVCRIYPAEINRFVELVPQGKACPPEAWSADKPVLMNGLGLVDAKTQALIERSRATDVEEVEQKAYLCADLEISTASLANEGFVIYSPQRDIARAALSLAQKMAMPLGRTSEWGFASNRRETIETLTSIGAKVVSPSEWRKFEYLGFFPAS
jgi:Fe-S-cluster containining protein